MNTPKKKSASIDSDFEKLTYEQALTELETLVTSLEVENLSLESTLAMFERGQMLARHCAELLDRAELKVQQLSGSELVSFSPSE